MTEMLITVSNVLYLEGMERPSYLYQKRRDISNIQREAHVLVDSILNPDNSEQ